MAIPKGSGKPNSRNLPFHPRKAFIFLLERYFYFLKDHEDLGLIVMDQTENYLDRQFAHRLESYFTKTTPGLSRAQRIVPSPFFVSSEMTYPVQAADVLIYCINWGFRLPLRKMDAPVRSEIANEFGTLLKQLQYQAMTVDRQSRPVQSYSIAYVRDPHDSRTQK